MKQATLFTWLLRCAKAAIVLCLVLLPVTADGGGGDGGVINLPGSRNNNQSQSWRLKIERADHSAGLVLRLHEEMRDGAIATIQHASGQVMVPIIGEYFVIEGETLGNLKAASVTDLTISIVDTRLRVVTITVFLDPESQAMTVIVW